jgi:hypothetical protein
VPKKSFRFLLKDFPARTAIRLEKPGTRSPPLFRKGDYFRFRLHRGIFHPRIRTSPGFNRSIPFGKCFGNSRSLPRGERFPLFSGTDISEASFSGKIGPWREWKGIVPGTVARASPCPTGRCAVFLTDAAPSPDSGRDFREMEILRFHFCLL